MRKFVWIAAVALMMTLLGANLSKAERGFEQLAGWLWVAQPPPKP